MGKEHDRLQSQCFSWFWNNYPKYRYLLHGNLNNLTTQHRGSEGAIRMAQLKTLGLVKGRTDLEFYYRGVLYMFDVKIGSDRLKTEQKEYIKKNEEQGGKFFEIRSFDQFQEIILNIIKYA